MTKRIKITISGYMDLDPEYYPEKIRDDAQKMVDSDIMEDHAIFLDNITIVDVKAEFEREGK